jgi:hypothetical protein
MGYFDVLEFFVYGVVSFFGSVAVYIHFFG